MIVGSFDHIAKLPMIMIWAAVGGGAVGVVVGVVRRWLSAGVALLPVHGEAGADLG